MNDSRRKLLTGYLGECWHEQKDIGEDDPYDCAKCRLSYDFDDHSGKIIQRTFTAAQDFTDLVRKMVEKGDLEEFLKFVCDAISGYFDNKISGDDFYYGFRFIAFLITDPARSCDLVGEWLEKERSNGRIR